MDQSKTFSTSTFIKENTEIKGSGSCCTTLRHRQSSSGCLSRRYYPFAPDRHMCLCILFCIEYNSYKCTLSIKPCHNDTWLKIIRLF